ncbi:hypothetical protein [Raoultella terrigena]|nr:hypothetical protein [Raoultella terrigena]
MKDPLFHLLLGGCEHTTNRVECWGYKSNIFGTNSVEVIQRIAHEFHRGQ